MKLSKIMKKEIDNLCDEYILEGADTALDKRSSPIIIQGDDKSVFYWIKKAASVAACFALAIAAVIAFTLIRNGVENAGDAASDSFMSESLIETDVTDNEDADVVNKKEEIYQKMWELYLANNEDIYLLENDKVYECGALDDRGYIWSTLLPQNSGKNYAYMQRSHISAPEKTEYICNIEGCQHDDLWCMAALPLHGGVDIALVNDDGTCDVFYACGLMFNNVEVDGEIWSNPDYYMYDEEDRYIIFEINLQKGTKKAVSKIVPSGTDLYYYYNGYLIGVCNPPSRNNDDASSPTLKAVAIDTRNGSNMMFETDVDVEVVGIVDGTVYMLDRRGTLYKAGPGLQKLETVKKLSYDGSAIRAEIIGDHIYYFNNTEEVVYDNQDTDSPKKIKISDLYVADLFDDSDIGKKLTDNVLMMQEAENLGKLFFTASAEETYTDSISGGTLYCIDAGTNEISTVFEDCGGDVNTIKYASVDTLIFTGTDYKSILEGIEYGDLNFASVYEYDMKTGAVTNLGKYSDYYGVSEHRLDP